MNELIYLFELDSVNKKPNDIVVAHKAVLNEIVNKGNRVVLSMNQLTDSKALSYMFTDDKKYEYLLELFKNSVILVSLYDDIRTPSQYIQFAIERCLADNSDTFIFSNLPIMSNDYVLLSIVRDALKYSDLSLLKELINEDGFNKFSIKANISELKFIFRFINLILEISKNDYGHNPPKQTAKHNFSFFMNHILSYYEANPTEYISSDVIHSLNDIRNNLIGKQTEYRSNWLQLLSNNDSNKIIVEKIINLIYNFTVEDSICNAKKSYDESNFQESFFTDFESRLINQLKKNDCNLLYELSEKDWKVAVRISKLKHNKSEFYLPFFISNKRLEWVMFIFNETIKYILLTIIFVFLFFLIEYVLSFLESIFDSLLGFYLKNEFTKKLITIFIFGLFGSLLAAFFDLPDIFTCIKKLVFCMYDLIVVIGGKYEYRN